jgi:peptidoglycan hydrolase-like protein with peptidoglycan-binding domain
VFNSYTQPERVEIQRQLARNGYYNGAIDGAFGPRTHQAAYEFARDTGRQAALTTTSGSYQIYAALLG